MWRKFAPSVSSSSSAGASAAAAAARAAAASQQAPRGSADDSAVIDLRASTRLSLTGPGSAPSLGRTERAGTQAGRPLSAKMPSPGSAPSQGLLGSHGTLTAFDDYSDDEGAGAGSEGAAPHGGEVTLIQ